MRPVFTRFSACLTIAACTFAGAVAVADEGSKMLITPARLKTLLDAEAGAQPPTILDVRSPEAYTKEHIPGALRIDLGAWKEKSLEQDGRRDTEYWAKAIGSLGIKQDTPVVVYGENPTNAARAWWLLKYAGAENVMLLDGGFPAWTAAKLPVTDVVAQAKPVKFQPEFQKSRLVEIEDLKPGAFDLVDTRSDDEFNAKEKGGHLPGAKHLEWKNLLDENGSFLSPAELKKKFAAQGITGKKAPVTYCGSGGRASLTAFALELAGMKNAKNYYCGWKEYSKKLSESQEPAEVETSCTGIVTLDGVPVAGATVTFAPKEGGKKVTATTNKLGQFKLLPPTTGEHTVTVSRKPEGEEKESSTTLRALIMQGSNEFNVQLASDV